MVDPTFYMHFEVHPSYREGGRLETVLVIVLETSGRIVSHHQLDRDENATEWELWQHVGRLMRDAVRSLS